MITLLITKTYRRLESGNHMLDAGHNNVNVMDLMF